MKHILGAFLALFIAGNAFADTCGKALTGVFTSYQAQKLCATFVGTATISGSLTFTGTGPIIAPTQLGISVGAANTPNYQLDNTGISFPLGNMGVRSAVYVPTFAATPSSGTNDLKVGFNAIPTAAANAAAGLPAVPAVGQVVEGYNEGPNAVRVKAYGTPGINGGAAGTYFPVATQAYFRCLARSATAWECGTLAVPTPTGP